MMQRTIFYSLVCFSTLILSHSLNLSCSPRRSHRSVLFSTRTDSSSSNGSASKDNKSMAFLRRIGRVGGAANRDFRFAAGVDEGPAAGRSYHDSMTPRKVKSAYQQCADTGVLDDLSEEFPVTCSGTQWAGVTDRVMGGASNGSLKREFFEGRRANVLRGSVSLENNGGFIQMATDLDSDKLPVDVSRFDGVEFDVQCQANGEKETFNVHLKNGACTRPFSSYRAQFEALSGKWTTVRIPWTAFRGHGPGASDVPFDRSTLKRAGIVAIGKQMDVVLALSGIRFYRQAAQATP